MVRGGLTQAEGHPPWVPVTPAVTVRSYTAGSYLGGGGIAG